MNFDVALGAVTLTLCLLPTPSQIESAHPQSQPAARSLRAFQPGVEIDWRAPAVHVLGETVLQSGSLEFFACFPGKEHESVVLLKARAEHVYMALGLIGLEPGAPAGRSADGETWRPPDGALIDVQVALMDAGGVAGEPIAATQWLQTIEYATTPFDRPWVFTGSRRLPDGGLAADQSGCGIALVHFTDNLLSPALPYPDDNASLRWRVDPAKAPPRGTAVRVMLSPARLRTVELRLDQRGDLYADGIFLPESDAIEIAGLQTRMHQRAALITVDQSTLRADQRRWARMFAGASVPVEWRRLPAAGLVRPAPARVR